MPKKRTTRPSKPKVRPRVPVAKPSRRHKSERDYRRKPKHERPKASMDKCLGCGAAIEEGSRSWCRDCVEESWEEFLYGNTCLRLH